MKVITLYNPWAIWVMMGWKTIETRTHPRFRSLKNQRIAIHAGQKYDLDATDAAIRWLIPDQFRVSDRLVDETRGCIIATADVIDFRTLLPSDAPQALIECQTPRFGLFLSNITRIQPVRIAGKMGIWRYHGELKPL